MRAALLLCGALLAGCEAADSPAPLVGTLEWDRVALAADRAEPVVDIAVREGDAVAAGDVLVQLDPARAQQRLRLAQAGEERTAARLSELLRGPRPEAIDEVRAALDAVEIELGNADVELARVTRLREGDLVSRTELDRARTVRDTLGARRAQALARLESLLEGTTAEELAQARAALAEARALVAERALDLQRLSITAPVGGVIDALPYEVGEQPPQGAAVVILLAGAAPYARVYVPETLRVHVMPGEIATVRVDGLDTPLRGRVRVVSAEHAFTPWFALTERDRGRLSYLAEIVLDPVPERPLPAGVPVEIEFPGLR